MEKRMILLIIFCSFIIISCVNEKDIIKPIFNKEESKLYEDLKKNEKKTFIEKEFNLQNINTIDDTYRYLGKPVKISTNEVRNIHNQDIKDTILEFYYDGLKVRFYKATVGNKIFCDYFYINYSNQYYYKYRIFIKMKSDDVEKLKNIQKFSDGRYFLLEQDETITYYTENGIINGIEVFRYYK